MKLVEGLDEERAAAAGRVQQPNRRQFVLPRFPKSHQGRTLGGVQFVQVIDAGIGKHRAGRAFGCFCVSLTKPLKTILEDAAESLLDVVPRDEGWRVECPLLLPPRLVFLQADGFGKPVQFVADFLQVGDRLLENVPQDVHVNQRSRRARFRVRRRFMGRAIVVFPQVTEVAAYFVRDLQAIQNRIGGKQPAVVSRDVQVGISFIDGMEQSLEIVPDGSRTVGITVLVCLGDGVGRQETALLAKGAEENAVQEFLGRSQNVVGRGLRILVAQPGEGILPHVGVLEVELLGQFVSRFVGCRLQSVEMASSDQRHHPFRAKEEDELLEQVVVAGKFLRVEALVGVLVCPFEVETGLPNRGDDDPIARQVDRVVVALIDRRDSPPGIGTVQRVFRSLPLQGHHKLRLAIAEVTENGIGKLPIDLDEPFAGNGVAIASICRAGVAEQRAEEIGQEVGKDLLLLERISAPGRNQFRPMHQRRTKPLHMGRQLKCHQIRTENVRAK